MKQAVLDKLASLERTIAQEKGDFSLFGLFLREEAQDKWDLLTSAPWLQADKKEGLKYLAEQVRSTLDGDELLSISRIVILEKGDPTLEAIHRAVKVKHGKVEVRNSNFSGVQITHACISTSSDIPPAAR